MIRSTHKFATDKLHVLLKPTMHSRTLGLIFLFIGLSTVSLDQFQKLIPVTDGIFYLAIAIGVIGAILCIRDTHTLDIDNNNIITTKKLFNIPLFKQTMEFDFAIVDKLHARDNEKFYLKHYHKNGYKSSDHYRTYQNVLTTIQLITKDKDELHLYTTVKHDDTHDELRVLANIMEVELDYEPSEAETVKFNYAPLITTMIFVSSAISAYLYFFGS